MSLVHRVEDLFKDKKYPERWQITTLNTVATIQNGYAFKSRLFNSTEGFPLLRIRDILESKIETYYSGDFSEEYIVNADDLIIGMDGDFNHALWKNKPTLLNQRVCRIKPNENFILKKFIFYGIGEFLKIINENTSSTTVKHLSSKSINEIPFPLPPLPEQERIVAKLDSLFAQHETMKKALGRIPQLLKDFRQQVLTQAITGKLTNVPDMQMRLMSDFFDVKTGATPKKGEKKFYENANIYWIKSGEVKNSYIYKTEELITELAVKTTNAKIFPKDTILIAMYGEGKTRGQIGWMKIEAATNQAIAALVNENLELITRKYIYLYCLSQYNEIRAKAEGGNQPNLNLSKIKNWEITIPKLIIEQEKITNRVENLFAKADIIEERYKTLKEKIDSLPQAILHKAFKGELVPQLPSDGDAKDLLEEILKLKKEIKKK
ncbi:restriction endonuclease subunit S [Chryseobacterium sp. KMC2]|uniref:restriction endonuclease subunit S n=1 Tax=Chryseobacterium sp. KMC2 TaxID=2800705 RepID=UPI00192071E3|nr:restriction endonuclease subunit S [Chryseobacterium sp. KMC2]MBL3547327.1 restriction endonuclease subunit S [Chryseobacterium sp. KMC2]